MGVLPRRPQLTLVRFAAYIEFYGQSRQDSYSCDQATTTPTTDQPGTQL